MEFRGDSFVILFDRFQGKHSLDQRKREFVKYSKKFSNTLKEYFKVDLISP